VLDERAHQRRDLAAAAAPGRRPERYEGRGAGGVQREEAVEVGGRADAGPEVGLWQAVWGGRAYGSKTRFLACNDLPALKDRVLPGGRRVVGARGDVADAVMRRVRGRWRAIGLALRM
jgi:hypothetical protein